MGTDLPASATGLQNSQVNLPVGGLLILKGILSLQPTLRERLLFGPSRHCLFLQKVVQRAMGSVSLARLRFSDGPLRGLTFECFTSEKYFFLREHFEREVQNAFKELIKPGDTVYDVGANAGYMALLASVLCGAHGQVYAFEPSPINFPRLVRTVELNGILNITPVNLAAADTEGTALLSDRGSESQILREGSTDGQTCSQIQTIRLDDFSYRDGHALPSLMKIDVEGFAGPCLSGAARLLEEVRPRIVCEIHDRSEAQQVNAILAHWSYRSTAIDSDTSFPRRIVALPL